MKLSHMTMAFALLSATPALSQAQQDFTLVNRTGYQIDQVYVGPVSSSNWGKDVMGKAAIEDGQQANITFSGRTNVCQWDLKVVYEDGDESEFRDVNLCNVSKVTLFWNRKAGETRFTVE